MTTQAQQTEVMVSEELDVPVEHAFQVFTEGIGSWWAPGHHILEAELAEMIFEPYPARAVAEPGKTRAPPPRSPR